MSAQPGLSGRDARAVFFYLIPTVLTNALPLISLPFLTRELTPADFGLIALAQIFSMVLFSIVNMGLSAVFERNYFQHKSDLPKLAALTWGCIGFLLLLGGMMSLLAHFTSPLAGRFVLHTNPPHFMLLFATLAAFIRGANEIAYRYLRNSEMPRTFAIIAVLEGVAGFAMTLVLVVGLHWGVVGSFVAQTIASVTAMVALIWQIARILPFHLEWKVLSEALRVGAPLTLRTVIGIVATQFDKYLLGLIGSLSDVGIYSVGQRIAQAVFLIMNSLDFVFAPRIYRMMFEARADGVTEEKRDAMATEVGHYLTPFVYGSALICILISVFSEEVLSLLTERSFHGSIEVAAILSVVYAGMFFGKVNGRQIIFAQKTFLSLVLSIVSIAFTAAITFPLILHFGLMGAAWGTLLASTLYAVVSQWQAQQCFRIHWENPLLTKIIGGLALIVFGHVALLQMDVGYLWRLAFKLASVGYFVSFGIRTGYLPYAAIKRKLLKTPS